MRKKTAVAAATVAAAAALLMGTYAWESISQKALNEKEEEVNPGARLHDDFNGSNKDVYVENFTDPDDGGVPIYARIRFYEYLEMGSGAGKSKDEVPDKKAVSVIEGAKLDDTSTWTLHNPYGTEDVFHDYFEWEEGGQTSYLPTFNKDEEDKTADINGTLEGTTPGDDVHYDDYVDYTDPANGSVTEKEIYSHSPLEESEEVQHDVKQTEDATVLTMSEWKAQGCPKGEFWVYDTDGWAYWATAIEPGTASGCLLNGIERTSAVSDDYYYGIDVEAQFVTTGEWGYDDDGNRFFGTGGEVTNDAMHLLAVASGEKYKIEITNRNNIKYLDQGDSATFKGKILFGTSVVMDDTLVWSVVDAKSDDTQINQNGNLKVGDDETSNCIIVKATSTNNPELSAMYVIYINVPDTYTVEIYTEDTIAAKAVRAFPNHAKEMKADVYKNGTLDKDTLVTWKMTGGTTSSIDGNSGVLNVTKADVGKTLTITATCNENASVMDSYEMTVVEEIELLKYVEPDWYETVNIYGKDWYVLLRKGEQYLLMDSEHFTSVNNNKERKKWSASNTRTLLNNQYFDSLNDMKNYICETELTTYCKEGLEKTTDKVFLLSTADVNGKTSNGTSFIDSDLQEYTYGAKPWVDTDAWKKIDVSNNLGIMLRTSYGNNAYHWHADGILYGNAGVQCFPVFWANPDK